MTLPEGSLTAPVMVALETWALAAPDTMQRQRSVSARLSKGFLDFTVLASRV
jgi:hypothetical protein